MFIKEVTLQNFRIYKGENPIIFEEDPVQNIHVLSGFNGFGKTTFLTALVWGLYGRHMQDVDDIFRKKIRESGGYLNYLEANLNRSARKAQETQYAVTLVLSDIQIPGISTHEVMIKRSFTSGDRSDQLEIKIDGFRNELVAEVGNDIFIQDFVLPKEIAKFFFFDAEKITAIAEVQSLEQKGQLARAYSEVLGIKKYIDLKNNLTDLRLKYRRESASPEEIQKLEAAESQVMDLERQLTQHEALILDFHQDLEDKIRRSNELQEKLIREGSSLSIERIIELRREKQALAERAKEYRERFNHLLDFAPFAIAGKLFFELEKQLHQEQRYSTRKGLTLQELKTAVQTIHQAFIALPAEALKPELDDQLKTLMQHILIEGQHPGADTEVLTVLHDFDENLFRHFSVIADNLRSSYKEQFKHLIRDIKRIRYEQNEVTRELARAESKEGDILVQKHRSEKNTTDTEIRDTYEKIATHKQQITNLTNELNARKKVLQELRKKLTVKEDLKEKDITADRLIGELDQFIFRIQEEKKSTLEQRICKSLNSFMHKKDFVSRVSVDVAGEIIEIDLFNDHNELINKADLSMGEKQLYATAILQALVEESNIEFPVFIDSPMQKLDAAHARHIITDFYPKVSKQVVLLPLLGKEMSREEYELFIGYVKSCHLILNIHEDASTFVKVDKNELFIKAAELERKENLYV